MVIRVGQKVGRGPYLRETLLIRLLAKVGVWDWFRKLWDINGLGASFGLAKKG